MSIQEIAKRLGVSEISIRQVGVNGGVTNVLYWGKDGTMKRVTFYKGVI